MTLSYIPSLQKKGLGDKKINRVNVSLSNRYDTKLKRLAIACNMPPTTLAGFLIAVSLDSDSLIDMLQEKFNVHSSYRVLPLENYETGEVELVLREKG